MRLLPLLTTTLFILISSLFTFAQTEEEQIRLGEANGLVEAQQYDQAITVFNSLLANHPTWVNAMFGKAKALTAKGDITQAINMYQRVIDLGSNTESNNIRLAYMEKGNCQMYLKRYNEAVVSYREMLKLSNRFSHSHYLLSIALVNTGQIEEAKTHLLEALNTDPLNQKANYSMLYLLSQEEGSISQLSLHALMFLISAVQSEEGNQVTALFFDRWENANKGMSGTMDDAFSGSGWAAFGGEETVKKSAVESTFENIDLMSKLNAGDLLNQPLDSVTPFASRFATNLRPESRRFIVYVKIGLSVRYLQSEDQLHSKYYDSTMKIHNELARSIHFPAYCQYLLYGIDDAATAWVDAHQDEVYTMTKYLQEKWQVVVMQM